MFAFKKKKKSTICFETFWVTLIKTLNTDRNWEPPHWKEMKSSIPKNYPTSEIKLKLIPRGSYIFQKKERSVSRGSSQKEERESTQNWRVSQK